MYGPRGSQTIQSLLKNVATVASLGAKSSPMKSLRQGKRLMHSANLSRVAAVQFGFILRTLFSTEKVEERSRDLFVLLELPLSTLLA